MKTSKLVKIVGGFTAGIATAANAFAEEYKLSYAPIKNPLSVVSDSDSSSSDSGKSNRTYSMGVGYNSSGTSYINAAIKWALGGFELGPYVKARFKDVQKESETNVTERETQYLGSGVYKSRTDSITKDTDTSYGLPEVGFEVTRYFNDGKTFEGVLRFGINEGTEKTSKKGTSTISYTRNGQNIGESVISNSTKPEETRIIGGSLEAGVFWYFMPGSSPEWAKNFSAGIILNAESGREKKKEATIFSAGAELNYKFGK